MTKNRSIPLPQTKLSFIKNYYKCGFLLKCCAKNVLIRISENSIDRTNEFLHFGARNPG
jgi:hypothetical protein